MINSLTLKVCNKYKQCALAKAFCALDLTQVTLAQTLEQLNNGSNFKVSSRFLNSVFLSSKSEISLWNAWIYISIIAYIKHYSNNNHKSPD